MKDDFKERKWLYCTVYCDGSMWFNDGGLSSLEEITKVEEALAVAKNSLVIHRKHELETLLTRKQAELSTAYETVHSLCSDVENLLLRIKEFDERYPQQ